MSPSLPEVGLAPRPHPCHERRAGPCSVGGGGRRSGVQSGGEVGLGVGVEVGEEVVVGVVLGAPVSQI